SGSTASRSGSRSRTARRCAPSGSSTSSPPQHWLLVRGTGERPLAAAVSAESLRFHSSTRRPSLQEGELAVCYASVWRTIFAIVEIAGIPENDPERDRWHWRFPIRPLVALDDLRNAPPVEAAGV